MAFFFLVVVVVVFFSFFSLLELRLLTESPSNQAVAPGKFWSGVLLAFEKCTPSEKGGEKQNPNHQTKQQENSVRQTDGNSQVWKCKLCGKAMAAQFS